MQFKTEFFAPSWDGFKLMPRDGTLLEIGNRMRRRGLRYTKAECLDLPPKIYEQEEVDFGVEQKRVYEEMREDLVARLRAADRGEDDVLATAATQLVAILRLAQITSGYVPDEDGRVVRLPVNPKLDALERIVQENIGDQQIIIWCCYRENYRMLTERLANFSPELLVGGMTVEERSDIEDRFQAGETRLLISNPSVGGSGLDLWKASLAIYYSQDYNPESRIQSEDRCHRKGSEIHNKVTYVDVMVKSSIDYIIQGSHAAKKSVADMVVDLREAIGV